MTSTFVEIEAGEQLILAGLVAGPRAVADEFSTNAEVPLLEVLQAMAHFQHVSKT